MTTAEIQSFILEQIDIDGSVRLLTLKKLLKGKTSHDRIRSGLILLKNKGRIKLLEKPLLGWTKSHPLKIGETVQVSDTLAIGAGLFPARVLNTDFDEELNTPCMEGVTELQDIGIDKRPFTAYLDTDGVWRIYNSIDNY